MAGAKRRSPTSTLVSKNAISLASSTLLDLPAKPKEIWSLREAINALKDQIVQALDRGYDYPEISKMLTQHGVEISASTLKYYLSSVRREDGGKTKRRRTVGKLTEKTIDKATKAVEGAVTGEKRRPGRKPKALTTAIVEAPTPAAQTTAKATKAVKVAKAPKATQTKATATKATATKTTTAAKATKVTKATPAKTTKAAATKATKTVTGKTVAKATKTIAKTGTRGRKASA